MARWADDDPPFLADAARDARVSAVDEELAALRNRAYGPDADIWSDPAALARLEALEAAVRRADRAGADLPDEAVDARGVSFGAHAPRAATADSPRPPIPTGPPSLPRLLAGPDAVLAGRRAARESSRASAEPAAPAAPRGLAAAVTRPPVGPSGPGAPVERPAVDGQASPAGTVRTVEPVGTAAPAAAPPPAPALSTRTRRAWIASLIATIVVTAGLTAWLFPFGVRDDLHHDARLSAQSGGDSALEDQLRQFGNRGEPTDAAAVYFGEYKGVGVYVVGDCIFAAMSNSDEQQGTSFFSSGCGADTLPATMDLYMPGDPTTTQYYGGNFPAQLGEEFPNGGVIRFTRDGDSVVVTEAKYPAPTGDPT